MAFPALHGSVAAAGGGSPLNYSNLVAFWESETGVTDSSGEVTSWVDQAASIDLTIPAGEPGPDLESNAQNGFDGISFEEFISSEPIDKKLTSGAGALDNFFFGSGTKAISFAARWDRTADFNFNLSSTICAKAYAFGKDEGWQLHIKPNGTLTFEHYMTNGSSWSISASGFYSVGDLVLGSIRYSGGNSTGSGTFRLWNGSSFVETGTISTASSSSKASDADDDFAVGNIFDAGDSSDNQPFQGPIFGLWLTSPFQISLDDAYMRRWIP